MITLNIFLAGFYVCRVMSGVVVREGDVLAMPDSTLVEVLCVHRTRYDSEYDIDAVTK